MGPVFAPTLIPDPGVEQQPSVRTECFAHAEDRPMELRAAAQSLQVTAASMQQALHQLAMLLLKPKVRPLPRFAQCADGLAWLGARLAWLAMLVTFASSLASRGGAVCSP